MMDMCVRHRAKCYDVGKLKHSVNSLSKLVRKLCAIFFSEKQSANSVLWYSASAVINPTWSVKSGKVPQEPQTNLCISKQKTLLY